MRSTRLYRELKNTSHYKTGYLAGYLTLLHVYIVDFVAGLSISALQDNQFHGCMDMDD